MLLYGMLDFPKLLFDLRWLLFKQVILLYTSLLGEEFAIIKVFFFTILFCLIDNKKEFDFCLS